MKINNSLSWYQISGSTVVYKSIKAYSPEFKSCFRKKVIKIKNHVLQFTYWDLRESLETLDPHLREC